VPAERGLAAPPGDSLELSQATAAAVKCVQCEHTTEDNTILLRG